MMTEISLNILDIAENSIRAQASLITISVRVDTQADKLDVTIEDNGCGMTPEQVEHVEDPFYTTRSTRKVGQSQARERSCTPSSACPTLTVCPWETSAARSTR